MHVCMCNSRKIVVIGLVKDEYRKKIPDKNIHFNEDFKKN